MLRSDDGLFSIESIEFRGYARVFDASVRDVRKKFRPMIS